MTFQNSSRFKVVTAYTGWFLLWTAIQTYLLTALGCTLNNALVDAAVTQSVLSVCGYTINTALRFYQPKQIVTSIFSWSIALALLCVFAQRWLLSMALKEQTDYPMFLSRSLLIRGAFDWLMISFATVTSWMWFYVNERQKSEQQSEKAERMAREAELSDLRNQLQPHFLFNSLNSISALVATSPELARTMIQQLSDFLRGTVRKDNRQLVTLEEELRHLELYLAIEKIRFGHRLSTEFRHDDKSLRSRIPSLLLQPIVENAIKFGLYDTVGEITITIQASSDAHYLTVEVKNPYDPATAHPRKGTGFGLDSIRRRLYLLYAQSDLLHTRQEEDQFFTTLKIPQLP